MRCTICGEKLQHIDDFNIHMKSHSAKTSDVCSKGQILASPAMPVGSKPDTKSYQCTFCDEEFTYLDTFSEHLRNHADNRQYQCSICGKIFAFNSDLERHMKTHTRQTSGCAKHNTCGGCPAHRMECDVPEDEHLNVEAPSCIEPDEPDAKLRQSAKTYMPPGGKSTAAEDGDTRAAAVKPKAFHCTACGKEFSQVGSFVTQLRTHICSNGKKSYQCTLCGSLFGDNDNSGDAGKEPDQCPVCCVVYTEDAQIEDKGTSFPAQANKGGAAVDLKTTDETVNEESINYTSDVKIRDHTHVRSVLEVKSFKPPTFETEIANTAYNAQLGSEKPHQCPTCGKGFTDKRNFREHLRTHTGEKPHQCPTCDMRFTHYNNFKSHMSTHTNEKPFACMTCGKEFAQSRYLKKHMRTHSEGEKPFQCTTCNARFTTNYSLKSHMILHTGEKPFMCTTCGAQFAFKRNWMAHQRTHMKGEKPYKCTICGKAFAQNRYLNRHKQIDHFKTRVRNHTKKVPGMFVNAQGIPVFPACEPGVNFFQCTICGEGFTHIEVFSDHKKTHKANEQHQCPVCDRTFASYGDLEMCMKSHSSEMSCPGSAESTENEAGDNISNVDYETTEGESTNAQTDGFGKTADAEARLSPCAAKEKCEDEKRPDKVAEHQRGNCDTNQEESHTNKHTPPVCVKIEVEEDDYDTGMTEALEAEPHHCKTCSEEYSYIGTLDTQLRIHICCNGERSYQCTLCGSVFANKKNENDGNEIPNQCPICCVVYTENSQMNGDLTGQAAMGLAMTNQEFASMSTGVKSAQYGTGEKPHHCTLCGKGFADRRNLKEHIRTHTGEKPHRCATCGASFTHYNNYMSHLRTHTTDRPFKCTICGREFSQNRYVKKHMRTHFEVEKPYQCKICFASFTESYSLKSHMITHTGEKPFICTVCGAQFAYKKNWNAHQKTHMLGEKPFKCTLCGQDFAQNRYLNRHMKTHHPEALPVYGSSAADLSANVPNTHRGSTPVKTNNGAL